jgi:hypothetical protein
VNTGFAMSLTMIALAERFIKHHQEVIDIIPTEQ